ncbi:MAG: hypothetical protein QOE65_2994 [Solirubrobacteraceae bacterium]|jgi:integrase|nr:hypothetical protein [Solirubrobacteraceae bacterium]
MAGHIKRRTYPSGRVAWRARFPDPVKGGTAQIERSFATKREAQDWIDEVKHAARTGLYVNPAHAKRTVLDVAQEWQATWADLAPKTRAGYESILERHIVGTAEEPGRFRRAQVGALTPDVVQGFVNDLAAQRKPNTVRRVYSVLRGILTLAVQRRYIGANPCDAVKLPKKGGGQREHVYLAGEEVRTLAESIGVHWRVLVYVAAYTGLRAGELWALRRRDVDLLRGTLTVTYGLKDIRGHLEIGPPKTHQRRTISLPKFLREMLAEHLASPTRHPRHGYAAVAQTSDGPKLAWVEDAGHPDALVFVTPGGRPVRHGLFYRRVFSPTARGSLPAEQGRCRFHDLRHTCASLAIEQGAHPKLIQARLGHENITTTLNEYGHLFPSVEAALADALDAGFRAAEQPDNVRELRAEG